jgi:Asp-tRNA(Asn)/Glu-tRNA(Gln) amidotransferase A subunit family amidase
MKNIAFATITELQKELVSNNLTREDIVAASLERARNFSHLNAVLELFDKDSILQASKSEGPLAGIPGFIKDNITQKNRKATCGSKILENFVSPYDSTAISRLKNDGALMLGRVNMDEFAMEAQEKHPHLVQQKIHGIILAFQEDQAVVLLLLLLQDLLNGLWVQRQVALYANLLHYVAS